MDMETEEDGTDGVHPKNVFLFDKKQWLKPIEFCSDGQQ